MNCRKIVFVMCAGKKFKMFLKRKLKLEHGCSISHNVFGLGEVAEPELK
jgi:hypothetical protein